MAALETFDFAVKSEPQGSFENRQNKSQLGDGYSVSAPDGINTETQAWSISIVSPTKTCSGADGPAILALAFLRRMNGAATSFNWKTPFGETIRVEAGAITPKKAGNVLSVSVAFKQVYR